MTDKSDERKAVPREPTDEMIEAGRHAAWEQGDARSAIVELSWRAMFDAAPVLATAPAEPALIAQTCMCPDQHCALHGAPVKTTLTVSTTAPAEPPKDGEVAALIERLRDIHAKLMKSDITFHLKGRDECERAGDSLFAEAADALARLAAPVPELTERERGVLRHALTGGRDTPPYRNHFAASEGHADMPTLRALVARGLMTERKSGVTPDTLFHCTEAGAKAVGLHLPYEPTAAPVPDKEK